ncbi:MAG: metal ABC transporter permease [Verrucomicrobiota bacterium]|nr:metal ABC transporter permease [Verrucomicrobiota bacterium]MEE2967248.1 metal ABC transporter permease [Verrucomicrobiota bacterium]|tara:strand:+ start:1574 stop:2482 length:909 start_codon:yes stop_codon:yes gene_type:complete
MSFYQIFIEPWERHASAYWPILAMAFLVTATCGLVGNYLVLRRISLVGDAISHSVLPGIAIAFILTGSRSEAPMFIGALVAGVITTLIIEVLHSRTRIKQDAAIGITFSTMFAIGVILISLHGSHTDLDLDCVLFGKLDFLSTKEKIIMGLPGVVITMGTVALIVGIMILLFYKELLVSSFDPNLAATIGISPRLVHYLLMCILSVVVVSAFSSVGAILVIAMLILPAATSYLLTDRLQVMMLFTLLHSFMSSISGVHLAVALKIPTAPATVVCGMMFFLMAWIFSPTHGLIRIWLRSRVSV